MGNYKNVSITAQKDTYEFLVLYSRFFLQLIDGFLRLTIEGLQIINSTLLFG